MIFFKPRALFKWLERNDCGAESCQKVMMSKKYLTSVSDADQEISIRGYTDNSGNEDYRVSAGIFL